MLIPKAEQIYKHFKGNLYKIIALAEHSETGEILVIYQALYGEGKVYARPLEMFIGKVDKVKYPDITQEYRFELQEDMTEEFNIDPVVLEFLDADTYEARINILASVRHRVTNDMLNTMAVACDVVLPEGDVTERYEALKYSLLTKDRYECSRMR